MILFLLKYIHLGQQGWQSFYNRTAGYFLQWQFRFCGLSGTFFVYCFWNHNFWALSLVASYFPVPVSIFTNRQSIVHSFWNYIFRLVSWRPCCKQMYLWNKWKSSLSLKFLIWCDACFLFMKSPADREPYSRCFFFSYLHTTVTRCLTFEQIYALLFKERIFKSD